METRRTYGHNIGFAHGNEIDWAMSIPKTTKSWVNKPKEPLREGGAISDRYNGTLTVAKPHPMPMKTLTRFS